MSDPLAHSYQAAGGSVQHPGGDENTPLTAAYAAASAVAVADAADERDDETAEQEDIVATFYELDHIRVPPVAFHTPLRRLYTFFIALGVPISRVKSPLEKQKEDDRGFDAAFRQKDDDSEGLSWSGVSPVPLEGSPRSVRDSWWVRWTEVQWVYFALFFVAWIGYFSVSVLSALESGARTLRLFFALNLLLALIASVLLANQILSKRLIGTRSVAHAQVCACL